MVSISQSTIIPPPMTAAVPKYWQSRTDLNRRSGSQNPVPYPLATALYEIGFPDDHRAGKSALHRKAPALASHLCYSLLAGLIPHPRWPSGRQGCLMLSPLYMASFGPWCGDGVWPSMPPAHCPWPRQLPLRFGPPHIDPVSSGVSRWFSYLHVF